MARKIEVTIVGDKPDVERAFRRSGKAAGEFDKSLGRASRGAIAASLSFKGLGRSVAFASGAFLGGVGIVSAIKSTVEAAEESQRVLGQTDNAVKRTGLSWRKYGDEIEKVTLKQSQMSGFDDERLKGTFALLLRRTKDVNEALRLNATAANVARGANIKLEVAAKMVQRASQGQSKGLAALGIQYTKSSTAAQLLAQINQKYSSSAIAYANTAAGAQDRFKVALENFQEVLGKEALPAIAKYLNKGADWLNQTKNQQRALQALRSAIGVVRDVVAALTPIVQGALTAIRAFSKAVGGAGKAVKVLAIALVTFKVASFVSGLGLIGGAATTASGEVAALRLSLMSLGTLAIPTVVIPLAYAFSKSKIGKKLHADYSGIDLAEDIGNKIFGIGGGPSDSRRYPVKAASVRPSPDTMTASLTHRTPQTFGSAGSGSAGQMPTGVASLSPAQRNALALSQARTPSATMAALVEQRQLIAAQIATVTRRLKSAKGPKAAKAFADQLIDLNNQDQSALDQIQSITEAGARDAKSKADAIKAAAAKRKAAAEKLQAALMATVDASIKGFGAHLGVSGRLTLADVNKAVTQNEQKAKAAAAAAQQASQYRALGFTSTGEELTPTRKALTSELAKTTQGLKGTLLDTDPNRNQLTKIRAVMNGNWKKITRDTKMRIKELLDALQPDKAAGPMTKAHALDLSSITKGLGLSRADARAIQFRLAGAHLTTTASGAVAGHGGVVIGQLHIHSNAKDPKQVAREVSRELNKTGTRNSQQIRGPFAGKRGV